MKVERSRRLPAPAERIYAVVMDPRRLEDWVTIHAGLVEAPSGRLRAGSRLVQELSLAGRRFKVRWTVVEDERPRRVVWEGHGPLGSRARVVYSLDELDGATRFTYLNEYDLPGGPLGRLAGPAVRRVTQRELDESLERLERLLG